MTNQFKRQEIKDFIGQVVPFFMITGISLVAMTLFRLIFYISYAEKGLFREYTFDVFHAFFLGIRYDLSILSYFQALPVFLFTFLWLAGGDLYCGFYERMKKRTVPLYYAAVFSFLLFFLAVDHLYYGFYHNRIDIMIFGFFEDDTWALVQTFWDNYPVVGVLVFLALFFYFLTRGIRSLFLKAGPFLAQKRKPGVFLAALLFPFLIVLAARGSLGLFPLEPMNAVISPDVFINKLSPNGIVMFYQAIDQKMNQANRRKNYIESFHYENNISLAYRHMTWPRKKDGLPQQKNWELADLYRALQKGGRGAGQSPKQKPHVVMFVMESMGGDWLRYQSKQFNIMGELEKHFQEDFYFPRFLSASGGTIGSITSIISGLPLLPSWPLASEQEFLRVPLETSITRPFQQEGYDVRFVYAGKVGWRNLYDYVIAQGFDSIEGENVIEKAVQEKLAKEGKSGPVKNAWGIYDEYLLGYVMDSLKEAKTPQFILVLTTTNHPPYDLPPGYQNVEITPPAQLKQRFVGDESLIMDRFQTYRYANEHLGRFLTGLKESPLGKKTIVGITGDHNFQIINYQNNEYLNKYSVPFYVYAPPEYRPARYDPDTPGCYLNIMPTLVSMALPQTTYVSLADSMFLPGNHYAVLGDWVINREGLFSALLAPNRLFAPWVPRQKNVAGKFQRLDTNDPRQMKAVRNIRGLYGTTQFILTSEAKRQTAGQANP